MTRVGKATATGVWSSVPACPAGDEGLGVRAALYSFGFLARRAAADRLDVHERELRVGLRVLRDAAGDVVGQIFISDSLENGAGYSSLLGQPLEAEALLKYMACPPRSSPSSFIANIVGLVHPRYFPMPTNTACEPNESRARRGERC